MKPIRNLLLAFIAGLFGCTPSGVVFENAVCIQNITTIDPTDGLRENQTVIIKGGKIDKIAPTAELKLSPKNHIIDGTGKYLIPGLWDAHIHFAFMESLAPRMFDLFMIYGITSVRDTGGQIDFVKNWKDRAAANPTDAPRVMIAGPLLDGMPNVYDGSDPGHPPLSVGSSSVEAITKQVQMLDSMGVDFLKAYEMLTPAQFLTVMKLGKEKGLKVTGHVPLSMDVITASNAGLNSMEHMRNLELSCASTAGELLKQRQTMLVKGKKSAGGDLRSSIHAAQRETAVKNYDDEKANGILEVLAKNHTWQIPTLTLNRGQTRMSFAQPEWQESFEYLPDTIRNLWQGMIDKSVMTEIAPFRKAYSEWMNNMAGKVHRAGIPMMAGTDTPIGFLTPGLSLHEELVAMVEAGLSPQEALKAATLNPAKYFNLENELGSLKEGMWADLIVLGANPLENIKNTQRIEGVVKQGKFYDQQALDMIRKRLREK
ncbi:MAG: amidohydrolase family protein [Cytophagales bacterium]|nr:amidohydrolase family protein [Cytophagales bacterium]